MRCAHYGAWTHVPFYVSRWLTESVSTVVSAEASRDGVFMPSSTPDATACIGRAGEIAPHPMVSEDESEGVRESGGSRERDECPPHLAHAAYTAKGEDAMYSNTS
jgi:hypothetical protein